MLCTVVKWIPRSLSGSQEPVRGLKYVMMPSASTMIGADDARNDPSARKCAGAGPFGVIASQVPTIGWVAMASGEACRAATVGTRATPRPPAASPAMAVRRVSGRSERFVDTGAPLSDAMLDGWPFVGSHRVVPLRTMARCQVRRAAGVPDPVGSREGAIQLYCRDKGTKDQDLDNGTRASACH